MAKIPRMNLHLRIQHIFLIVSFIVSTFSGLGLIHWHDRLPGFGLSLWYRVHIWSGAAVGLLLIYHFLYLVIRSYVEGRPWSSHPLSWRKSDAASLKSRLRFLAVGGDETPVEGVYRPPQKVFYWAAGAALTAAVLSGGAMSFWIYLKNLSLFGSLEQISLLHRGLSLFLLAAACWHLYGALVWKGRWEPEWCWLTGTMEEDRAKEKFPGLVEIFREQEKERLEGSSRKSSEEIESEQQQKERETVESELKKGNEMAREEKFVEALYHFRRAIEIFPSYSQAHYNMATVLMKMGEKALAVESFRLFLQADPFHPLSGKAEKMIQELEKKEEP